MGSLLMRNPEVVWRDEPDRRDEILAAMEKGEDATETGWVIVVDKGEIHQLNLIAGDIWLLCDGTMDEGAIAAELVKTYDADPTLLTVDVKAFVGQCLEFGWLLRKE